MEYLFPFQYLRNSEYFYHYFCNRLTGMEDRCLLPLRNCEYCILNYRVLQRIILFQRTIRARQKFLHIMKQPKTLLLREIGHRIVYPRVYSPIIEPLFYLEPHINV